MHLFSRRATLSGAPNVILGWSADIRAHASGVLGSEIALWSVGFGAPTGTMAWSMRVEGLAGVAANSEKLLADEGYVRMAEAGRELFVGPAEDSLVQPLNREPADSLPPVGSVATITTATMGAGYNEVLTWCMELTELVEGITGDPLLFGVSSFGTFGQVGWIGINGSAADADTAGDKLNANPDYLAKVSTAAGMFVPGSGHRMVMTRVA